MVTTCPRCATPREGSYRMCPSCGFDYWKDAAATTCPRCQVPRSGSLPICPNCGYDYRTSGSQTPTVYGGPTLSPGSATSYGFAGQPTTERPSDPVSMLAGCAWLIGGAFLAYLALLQLGVAGYFPGQDVQLLAAWNGIGAALLFYFGARLVVAPNKGILGTSAAFAVVAVAFQGYQIANGATHWAFLATTAAAIAAGVLSLVARPNAPASRHTGAGGEKR